MVESPSVWGSAGRVDPSFAFETSTSEVNVERLANALGPSEVRPVDWISTVFKVDEKMEFGIGPAGKDECRRSGL